MDQPLSIPVNASRDAEASGPVRQRMAEISARHASAALNGLTSCFCVELPIGLEPMTYSQEAGHPANAGQGSVSWGGRACA